jgi:hypothetical protein
MIGVAFFVFIFAILTVSIDQFWQMTLDDAVRNATRQVQIGNVTTGPQFVSSICKEFGLAAPYCSNNLQYSVVGGSAFSGASGISPAAFSASGTLSPGNQFNTPSLSATGSPQFLLVQVAYPLPFRALAVSGGVATENGTPSLLSSVATAMEP